MTRLKRTLKTASVWGGGGRNGPLSFSFDSSKTKEYVATKLVLALPLLFIHILIKIISGHDSSIGSEVRVTSYPADFIKSTVLRIVL